MSTTAESGAVASRPRDELREFPDVVGPPVGESFVPSLMPSRLPFGSTSSGSIEYTHEPVSCRCGPQAPQPNA